MIGYSDTFRLNNFAGNLYTPVGYGHCAPPDLDEHRILLAEFHALDSYISHLCSQNNCKIGMCLVDLRMMPIEYGENCYTAIESNLISLLVETNSFCQATV